MAGRLIQIVGLVITLPNLAAGQDRARAPDAPSAFARAKAEALLRDHLPCLGCHKLNGNGGTIGPDLTTVRDRRSSAYIASIIADPQRVVPGSTMPRTAMPESTRELITKYLASQPGSADGAVPVSGGPPPSANATPDGAALYAKWCAACHGETGRGDGPNAASLPIKPAAHASRDAMAARPDDSLFDTIAAGGAVMNRSPRMPAFGATLAVAEIRALVRHIRTLCRCEGPGWSRDD
jgi:mono/diheme cytochrome c family protein